MTQMQLIQHISTFDKHIKTVKLRSKLKEESFSLRELVDLTFYPDKAIAMRASKILEYIVFKFPENYCGDLAYIIERAPDVNCIQCRKHYAKMMMRLTSPEVSKEVRSQMKEANFEKVIELCFRWLLDPRMLTGIRASAAETLFNMRHRYPWIAEALSRELGVIMLDAQPMLRTRGNYILSFLHCED